MDGTKLGINCWALEIGKEWNANVDREFKELQILAGKELYPLELRVLDWF